MTFEDLSKIATPLSRELRKRKSALTQETRLHGAVETSLVESSIPFEKEFRLNQHNRLDFFVDGKIAIEVKKGGAGFPELRQVGRYLEDPRVHGCVVVALRFNQEFPASLLGKPILKVELWRMLL